MQPILYLHILLLWSPVQISSFLLKNSLSLLFWLIYMACFWEIWIALLFHFLFGIFLQLYHCGNHLVLYLKILSSDMSYGARLERFKAFYSGQFLNVGIAEENLIGVSAGLTSEGYKCVALAQATFITMRCYEQ